MFVGHDGISFAAPRSGVRLPLWAFFVAVRWLDVVWWLLVLMGIEKLRITPGFTQANALDLYHMRFTHSLPSALALSAIFAGAVAMFAATGARACFCWSQPCIGGSTSSCTRPIWRSTMRHVVVSFPMELALLGAGAWLYVRAIPFTRAGRYSRWVFAARLAAVQVYANFGPPPSSPEAMAVIALSLYGAGSAGGTGGAREHSGDIGESKLSPCRAYIRGRDCAWLCV